MIALDLTQTSHTTARTGIQRVSRALVHALRESGEAFPVCYDRFAMRWRRLLPSEEARLALWAEAGDRLKRGTVWLAGEQLAGWRRRFFGVEKARRIGRPRGLIAPEIFHPRTARAFDKLFASLDGPKVALFHDAHAFREPRRAPPVTVKRFPAYLRALARFDAVAAVSEASRAELHEVWQTLGVTKTPPVVTIPLGSDPLPDPEDVETPEEPVVLLVGTLEARKNHIAFLGAAERLWQEGLRFSVEIIGAVNPFTGEPAVARIGQLRHEGYPVRWSGPKSDRDLAAAYRRCAFAVYPSLFEGFALPVEEALQSGRPVLLTNRGALPERAAHGGCLVVEGVDEEALADGLRKLLSDEALRARLAAEAGARPVRSWRDYAHELAAFLQSLG